MSIDDGMTRATFPERPKALGALGLQGLGSPGADRVVGEHVGDHPLALVSSVHHGPAEPERRPPRPRSALARVPGFPARQDEPPLLLSSRARAAERSRSSGS